VFGSTKFATGDMLDQLLIMCIPDLIFHIQSVVNAH